MKRIISFLLALSLLSCCAFSLAEDVDYTLAGKLYKQLWAGSGFSGTLTFSMESESGNGLTTTMPVVIDADFISIRQTTDAPASARLDLSWKEEEETAASAHISAQEETLAFSSDLLGEDWYTMDRSAAENAPVVTAEQKQAILDLTALPSLAVPAAQVFYALSNEDSLSQVIASAETEMDMWIEQFRSSAQMEKTEDGTAVISLQYLIPPRALKRELKQLLGDLFADGSSLTMVSGKMSDEDLVEYLDPEKYEWYCTAIDALPIEDDLTISRVVTMKGRTLFLELVLPLYDVRNGSVTITYNRTADANSTADTNTVIVTTADREVRFVWQPSGDVKTGLNVKGSYTLTPAETGEKLAFDWQYDCLITEGIAEDGRSTYAWNAAAAIDPVEGNVPSLNAEISALFLSKESKSAATELRAELVASSSLWDGTVRASFDGKTRKKWEPEALPETKLSLSAMSAEEKETLALKAFSAVVPLLKNHFVLENLFGAEAISAEETVTPSGENVPADEESTAESVVLPEETTPAA